MYILRYNVTLTRRSNRSSITSTCWLTKLWPILDKDLLWSHVLCGSVFYS